MHLVSKRLLIAGAAALLLAGAACGGGDDGGDAGGGGSADEPVPYGAPASEGGGDIGTDGSGAPEEYDSSGGSSSGASSRTNADFGGLSAAATTVSSAIIKTADVELKVPHSAFQTKIIKAEEIAGKHGGYILASNVNESTKYLSGSVSIRVPVGDFEAALGEMTGLGTLKNKITSGEEVSQEYIDLQARLRNWKLQEATILDLMDRSTSIEDTIRVQQQLSTIQLEIEQLQGRLNFLRDQTTYGTITASFITGAAPAPPRPTPIVRAWRQAVDTMEAIGSGLVLSLGVVIPMLILLGLIWLVVRQFRPKLS